MKKVTRLIAIALCISLMAGILAVPASAKAVPSDAVVHSTVPILGPIDGYIEGKTVNKSHYQNIATAAIAAAVIGQISGIGADKALSVYSGLCIALAAAGISDIFYTRTIYTSEDGMYYYYKYTYYSDSGHNHQIGEPTYSYLYTLWY